MVAVSQAPSPESNPNSPLPVIATVSQYLTAAVLLTVITGAAVADVTAGIILLLLIRFFSFCCRLFFLRERRCGWQRQHRSDRLRPSHPLSLLRQEPFVKALLSILAPTAGTSTDVEAHVLLRIEVVGTDLRGCQVRP